MADLSSGPAAADMRAILKTPPEARAAERLSQTPYDNALLRTTCVPTRLDAGHADNLIIVGYSNRFRPLIVSHTDRGGRVRVISARQLTSTERRDDEEEKNK